jgi:ribosome recycling factor
LSFIEKAISENQNLGLTPNNDGRVIRVNIPPLNEETRTQLTKVCKEKAESANISMRNARHEVLNSAKADEKSNVITQDQLVKVQKDLDKLIDEYHQKIQKIVEDKEKEIMSV